MTERERLIWMMVGMGMSWDFAQSIVISKERDEAIRKVFRDPD